MSNKTKSYNSLPEKMLGVLEFPPQDIIEAAAKVINYAKQNGLKKWHIMGLTDKHQYNEELIEDLEGMKVDLDNLEGHQLERGMMTNHTGLFDRIEAALENTSYLIYDRPDMDKALTELREFREKIKELNEQDEINNDRHCSGNSELSSVGARGFQITEAKRAALLNEANKKRVDNG